MFCRSVPHSVIPSEEHPPLAEDVHSRGTCFFSFGSDADRFS